MDSTHSARLQASRPTKNEEIHETTEPYGSSNAFSNFVAAFVARLEAGDSISHIRKMLENESKPEMGTSVGLITKCKVARADNPSVFCFSTETNSSSVEDEDDEMDQEETPLEGAQPFGGLAGSVGVPHTSAQERGAEESMDSDRKSRCNCEDHRLLTSAQGSTSVLQTALDTIVAASATTFRAPSRLAAKREPRTADWSSDDLSPFYRRLSRRRLLHRTAATAGGGDMVSTYQDADGEEFAIVDSGAAV